MRSLFNSLTIFSLLGLVLCQQYVDVHVCNGFESSSPIQATVTVSSSSWSKNITFAQCVDFAGVTTVGGTMTAAFNLVLYTPTGPSSTIKSTSNNALTTNSGQNVFVVWATDATNQNLQLTKVLSADVAIPANQALYVGGDFTYDLKQVNITVPNTGGSVLLDFGQVQSLLGPVVTNVDPHTTVVGYYTNGTSGIAFRKDLGFPVGNGSPVMINTWPGSSYYALLVGSIGNDVAHPGWRICGGPNGINGFGITFNSTGSAPLQYSSTGPQGNYTSSTGPKNGAQGIIDAVSPLSFILAAIFALFATQL